jgi:UDP-4-amino-4,6-dideoxy-N-acetyl-beta-L-altrosamine N-acetyltransferase
VIDLIDCAEEHRWLLLEWRNSDRVAPFMYDRDPIAAEVHDRWYTELLTRERRRGWVVTMDDKPVGAGFLSDHRAEHRRAEFGLYLADEATRGKGVGTAALYLLCEHAFTVMGLHKLCCEAFSFNEAAIAMYQKVGFGEEGVLRDHFLREGNWVHVHQLAMFENSWESRRAALSPKLKKRGLIS